MTGTLLIDDLRALYQRRAPERQRVRRFGGREDIVCWRNPPCRTVQRVISDRVDRHSNSIRDDIFDCKYDATAKTHVTPRSGLDTIGQLCRLGMERRGLSTSLLLAELVSAVAHGRSTKHPSAPRDRVLRFGDALQRANAASPSVVISATSQHGSVAKLTTRRNSISRSQSVSMRGDGFATLLLWACVVCHSLWQPTSRCRRRHKHFDHGRHAEAYVPARLTVFVNAPLTARH